MYFDPEVFERAADRIISGFNSYSCVAINASARELGGEFIGNPECDLFNKVHAHTYAGCVLRDSNILERETLLREMAYVLRLEADPRRIR